MPQFSIRWFAFIWVLLASVSHSASAGLFNQGPYEINVDQSERQAAQVYLPKKYDNQDSWPLVVLLHAFGTTGTLQDLYFGLSARVSSKGFVLLIPEGTQGKDGKQFWNGAGGCCDFGHTQVDDKGYLLSLIQKTQEKYRINPKRIYLLGHSNGGFMAHRLACEHSSLFAGIASLAGLSFKDMSQCQPENPVPLLQVHALDDQTIFYPGSTQGDLQYASAPEMIQHWVKVNGCTETPKEEGPLDLIWSISGKDTTLQTWSQCRDQSEVALWTIRAHPSCKLHNAHIPWLSIEITSRILDFLLSHEKQ